MKQFFLANEIADEQKKITVFLTVIGTKTYTLLRNLVAPEKPATKTYTELVATLKAHLNPKLLVITERFKFHCRYQKEGESIAQYIAVLRKLAEHCNFKEYLQEAIRDKLVCGIQNEATQRRLLAEADLTLQRAQEIAQGMEAASKEAVELRASNRTQVVHRTTTIPERKKSCYRCGSTRHTLEKCFYKTTNCHNCGKQGHIAKVCKAQKLEKKQGYQETKIPERKRTKKRMKHGKSLLSRQYRTEIELELNIRK